MNTPSYSFDSQSYQRKEGYPLESSYPLSLELVAPFSSSVPSLWTDRRRREGIASIIDYDTLIDAFTIDGSATVFPFLERHSIVIPALLDAEQTLRYSFPYEPYHLSLEQDPEYPTEQRIVISVSTLREVDDALQRMDTFYNAWLPMHTGEAYFAILVTLRFL